MQNSVAQDGFVYDSRPLRLAYNFLTIKGNGTVNNLIAG